MMEEYDPRDWYWHVRENGQVWSSAAGGYVQAGDGARLTYIDTEKSLTDVLRPYGLPGPSPTQADYAAAIQAHIDATAKQRGYNDGVHLASYVASTVSPWSAEAAAFVAWRDAVWLYAYQQMDLVTANERAKPAVEELVAELPVVDWPA